MKKLNIGDSIEFKDGRTGIVEDYDYFFYYIKDNNGCQKTLLIEDKSKSEMLWKLLTLEHDNPEKLNKLINKRPDYKELYENYKSRKTKEQELLKQRVEAEFNYQWGKAMEERKKEEFAQEIQNLLNSSDFAYLQKEFDSKYECEKDSPSFKEIVKDYMVSRKEAKLPSLSILMDFVRKNLPKYKVLILAK